MIICGLLVGLVSHFIDNTGKTHLVVTHIHYIMESSTQKQSFNDNHFCLLSVDSLKTLCS